MADFYDNMGRLMDKIVFKDLRGKALARTADDLLEIGVGTGKNLPYYKKTQKITAIDFSQTMLQRAEKRKKALGLSNVTLRKMDVEHLGFADNSFDGAVSTFVFCTVPHPIAGLAEVKRVLRPGAKAVFLEHMRSPHWFVNILLYAANIITRLVLGTSLIRRTQANIERAGFVVRSVESRFFGVVRLIVAEKQ